MSIMKMVREVETVRRMLQDSDSEDESVTSAQQLRVNEPPAPTPSASDSANKTAFVKDDKLARFVDKIDEENEIELDSQPLRLGQRTSNELQPSFPSELKVDLDINTKTQRVSPIAIEQSDIISKTKKSKRSSGLKLTPAPSIFTDELVFDDEPPLKPQTTTAKKDLSAFKDDDEPSKSVKKKTASNMKLITLDSMNTPLKSMAAAAVQSITNSEDELFDDLELPSKGELKRRLNAVRGPEKSLPRRQSSGHINNSALEDWCENDDDDVLRDNNSATNKKSAMNDKSNINPLTVS